MMNELTWAFVNEFFRIFRSQRVRVKNSGIEIILCCNWSAYFSRASNDSGSLFVGSDYDNFSGFSVLVILVSATKTQVVTKMSSPLKI